MSILEKINSPKDVRALDFDSLSTLCDEIRDRLVDVISKTGGHLASNLGVVELSVAIDKVFDLENDVVIFDVGHQSYVHKLLSGRNNQFETLRKKNGISGFTKPNESRYDASVSGHASVSISTAIGMARAKKLNGESGKVICIIGDGSFTGGLVYEAMNNLPDDLDNIIIILNDNSMSISKNKSAVSRYFMKLRITNGYIDAKSRTKRFLESIPVVGKPVVGLMSNVKSKIRRSLYESGTIFEEFGFNYVGVADGNNLKMMISMLEGCNALSEPVFLHIVTKKGKGYLPAEENPGKYHGVSSFNIDKVNAEISLDNSFSNYFGYLLAEAGADKRICAITAAMKYATGLYSFANSYPERFFDVGICEEHAVVFAAGLSRGGFKPVVAIYSTFLQRSYDQIFQDAMLNNANILFAVDRAGLVGNDGETHQGIFDAAYLSQFSIPIASPANFAEMNIWLKKLLAYDGVAAIRYPRGGEVKTALKTSDNAYDFIGERHSKTLIITYGRLIFNVIEAAGLISGSGIESPDLLKLNLISPIDPEAVSAAKHYESIMFVEEGVLRGGIGEHFLAELHKNGFKGKYHIRAIDNFRVPHMTVSEQLDELGFSPNKICDEFIKECR